MRYALKALIDLFISFTSLIIRTENHPGEKRVLILRKDGLGDCLIFYPSLRAYREFYKDAKITLIFPSIFESLAPLLSDVDEVIWFDHASFRNSFRYRQNFMHNLKRKGYDVALYPVFTKEKIADKMLSVTDAKEKVTFDDVKTESVSELDRNLDFAEYVTRKRPLITFPTVSTQNLPLAADLSVPSPYVIIFPGTSFATYRRWPSERFAEIIDMIVAHNLTPVLCGSAKEKILVEEILEKLQSSSKDRAVNLAGKTNFADMAHLLKKSEFYFGSDTGILHLAVSVGTPTIGIIGSGGFGRFFPYGDPARNRAVYDTKSMEGAYPVGTWEGADRLPTGAVHPSILAISALQARREVDYMLKFLYQNLHEKTH